MTPAPSRDLSQAPRLVEARGVSVRFGRRSVLEAVDLTVHAGEIVTLVGLNGAGKSTLIRVLLGIVRPNAGEVVRAPGLRIGYSPQHVHRDPILPMTVQRFLTLGAPAPRERLETLLARSAPARSSTIPWPKSRAESFTACSLRGRCCASPDCWCSTSRSRESTSRARASSTA